MIIPWQKLSEQALANLIREFILREGTDYGAVEQSLEGKERQVRKQLTNGEIFVVFDTKEDTASIATKNQLKGML